MASTRRSITSVTLTSVYAAAPQAHDWLLAAMLRLVTPPTTIFGASCARYGLLTALMVGTRGGRGGAQASSNCASGFRSFSPSAADDRTTAQFASTDAG